MIFPRYSALLALVLFANSCSKDSPVTESEITPDPIFAMMATDSPPDEATNPRVRPQVDKCDCFIRIVDFDLRLPNGQPYNGDIYMTTSTDIDCAGGCDVIESFYDPLQCENNPTSCQLDVSTQNPLSRIDFNCLVERDGNDI